MQAAVNYNSYDTAFEEGYNAALEAIKDARKSRQYIKAYTAEKVNRERAERLSYFLKQRLAGAALLTVSVIGIIATGGEFGIALATIPAGLFILLTKHRLFN